MKYLNDILINWNNSDFNDTELLKASDIKNNMKSYLVYILNKPGRIKIFDIDFDYFNEFKDKVYINGEHIQLDKNGYTVNEYEPGEYYVYIDGFNKINEIGDYTFYGCSSLTSIIIPDSVAAIGFRAFLGCKTLTSVTIPNSMTAIGYGAFQRSGLISVIIPNSVKMIGVRGFYNCTNLTQVTIPNSVKMIGAFAFKNCINLKTVYIEDIDKFNEIEFEDEYSDPTCYGAKLIELSK